MKQRITFYKTFLALFLCGASLFGAGTSIGPAAQPTHKTLSALKLGSLLACVCVATQMGIDERAEKLADDAGRSKYQQAKDFARGMVSPVLYLQKLIEFIELFSPQPPQEGEEAIPFLERCNFFAEANPALRAAAVAFWAPLITTKIIASWDAQPAPTPPAAPNHPPTPPAPPAANPATPPVPPAPAAHHASPKLPLGSAKPPLPPQPARRCTGPVSATPAPPRAVHASEVVPIPDFFKGLLPEPSAPPACAAPALPSDKPSACPASALPSDKKIDEPSSTPSVPAASALALSKPSAPTACTASTWSEEEQKAKLFNAKLKEQEQQSVSAPTNGCWESGFEDLEPFPGSVRGPAMRAQLPGETMEQYQRYREAERDEWARKNYVLPETFASSRPSRADILYDEDTFSEDGDDYGDDASEDEEDSF